MLEAYILLLISVTTINLVKLKKILLWIPFPFSWLHSHFSPILCRGRENNFFKNCPYLVSHFSPLIFILIIRFSYLLSTKTFSRFKIDISFLKSNGYF